MVNYNTFCFLYFQKLFGSKSKSKSKGSRPPPGGAGVVKDSTERGLVGPATSLDTTDSEGAGSAGTGGGATRTAAVMGNMCPGSGTKPQERSVHMSGNNATISSAAMPVSPGDATFGIQSQHNNSGMSNMNPVSNPLMSAEDSRPLPKPPAKRKLTGYQHLDTLIIVHKRKNNMGIQSES